MMTTVYSSSSPLPSTSPINIVAEPIGPSSSSSSLLPPRPLHPALDLSSSSLSSSSSACPNEESLPSLDSHPLHKAWVGWRCLCFSEAPPGTSPLVHMRVNETLSHVIGVHAERDSETQSGVTTPRDNLSLSRGESERGHSLIGRAGEGASGRGEDGRCLLQGKRKDEIGDEPRKKSKVAEEQEDPEYWISTRSGGERLAELVLLTQKIGGPFEREILRFLGWHHAKCNLAFDDVLSQLEKERIQEENPSHLMPGKNSSSVRTAADGGRVGDSADSHEAVKDDNSLHAINKEILIDAVRRFPSVKYFAESLKLDEAETGMAARLEACEERKKKLRILCDKARRERDLLVQEEETLKARHSPFEGRTAHENTDS
ncbi:hypothetical protein CSUI_010597 [Cystoisospora suis]|uniref:Uncharacterized protein n=1 Tax=Cystoisospora suis TaxID=483139 RepID=A0A2C6JX31_9APIC|nr:hypothetical protein CSUI_010597 [Cystoisospora suis]